jgi:hypothetical protein
MKNWIKISESAFQLLEDNRVLAVMHRRNKGADCEIGASRLRIRPLGLLNTKIEISDAGGQVLCLLVPANWYGSRWNFRLYGRDYQLLVRNNPLAEYVIQENGRDVLAYGLKTNNGRVITVISDHRGESLPELDLLLWYLFAPVAQSETGHTDTETLDHLLQAL